jgi:hypothetical protein
MPYLCLLEFGVMPGEYAKLRHAEKVFLAASIAVKAENMKRAKK